MVVHTEILACHPAILTNTILFMTTEASLCLQTLKWIINNQPINLLWISSNVSGRSADG